MRGALSRIRPSTHSRQVFSEVIRQGEFRGTPRQLVPDEPEAAFAITLCTLAEHETLALRPMLAILTRNWIDGEEGVPPKPLEVSDEIIDVNTGMVQLCSGLLACQAAAESEHARLMALGVTPNWSPSEWSDEEFLAMMTNASLLEQLGRLADRALAGGSTEQEGATPDPLAPASSSTASIAS